MLQGRAYLLTLEHIPQSSFAITVQDIASVEITIGVEVPSISLWCIEIPLND